MRTGELELGMRIRIERIQRRLRQRDVAVRADLSASTVSDIECGWKAPTADQLAAICAAIGICPDDLKTGGGQ